MFFLQNIVTILIKISAYILPPTDARREINPRVYEYLARKLVNELTRITEQNVSNTLAINTIPDDDTLVQLIRKSLIYIMVIDHHTTFTTYKRLNVANRIGYSCWSGMAYTYKREENFIFNIRISLWQFVGKYYFYSLQFFNCNENTMLIV